ncbi:hypothetical protein LY76DRAFT_585751 [Colletotrichum caudatum]|nr:hypothetical protein LY76DRAFT_585751 [Colletotrichum caudatum]
MPPRRVHPTKSSDATSHSHFQRILVSFKLSPPSPCQARHTSASISALRVRRTRIPRPSSHQSRNVTSWLLAERDQACIPKDAFHSDTLLE